MPVTCLHTPAYRWAFLSFIFFFKYFRITGKTLTHTNYMNRINTINLIELIKKTEQCHLLIQPSSAVALLWQGKDSASVNQTSEWSKCVISMTVRAWLLVSEGLVWVLHKMLIWNIQIQHKFYLVSTKDWKAGWATTAVDHHTCQPRTGIWAYHRQTH